jgi:hypothetical protein
MRRHKRQHARGFMLVPLRTCMYSTGFEQTTRLCVRVVREVAWRRAQGDKLWGHAKTLSWHSVSVSGAYDTTKHGGRPSPPFLFVISEAQYREVEASTIQNGVEKRFTISYKAE